MKSSTQLFRSTPTKRCSSNCYLQTNKCSAYYSSQRSSSLTRLTNSISSTSPSTNNNPQFLNCSTTSPNQCLGSAFTSSFYSYNRNQSCSLTSLNTNLSSTPFYSSNAQLFKSVLFSSNQHLLSLTNQNSRTRSRSGERLFCSSNSNQFSIQRQKIRDVIASTSFAFASKSSAQPSSSSGPSSSSSSSSESESESSLPYFRDVSQPSSSPPTSPTHLASNPILLTIHLSLSFSNGYFSLRFAHRECLFHFWSPIELVLKMFQEELTSGANAQPTSASPSTTPQPSSPQRDTPPVSFSVPSFTSTTMSPEFNLGRPRLPPSLNPETADPLDDQETDGAGQGFLEQLHIEFADQSTSNVTFDHIKFGRIEMVAEHLDNVPGQPDDTESKPQPSSPDEQCSQCPPDGATSPTPTTTSQTPTTGCRHRYRLARLMPFGYALLGCDLDEVYFVGTATGKTTVDGPDGHRPRISRPLRIHFKMNDKTKTLKTDIEQWHQRNPLDSQTMLFKTKTIDPNLYEQNELVVRFLVNQIFKQKIGCERVKRVLLHQFLQQEREMLMEKFQPLQQEFAQLIQSARKESRRKFKFGGLFLLSAQLGFVGRLTYFEYSWDIMEPVTWIMTYTTMVGSFAYYIVTSEEYVVPMVEKRMIASRFWKLAQSRQFDVQQYKQLKEELKQLDKRIGKLRAGF